MAAEGIRSSIILKFFGGLQRSPATAFFVKRLEMSALPLSDIRLPCTSEDEDDRLATFMNHDSAYFVFRRFNALNLRRLLQLQAHLLSLEREFERLKGQGHDAHASSRRDELMVEVDDNLHRYSLYP